MSSTIDTLLDGRLVLKQPEHGYRSSVDSLLLAFFVSRNGPYRKVLDMGSGSGTVGLTLVLADLAAHLTAVEYQEELAALCMENAALNQVSERVEVIASDVRALRSSFFGSRDRLFDLIVMNPPFWPRTHRLPDNLQRRIACHEVICALSDWLAAASALLHPRKGRLSLIFPAQRISDLFYGLRTNRLSCSTIQMVHPLLGRNAELVLLEARLGTSSHVEALPPIILKSDDGSDTAMLQDIVTGRYSGSLRRLPDKR